MAVLPGPAAPAVGQRFSNLQGVLLLTKTPGFLPVKTRLAMEIGINQAESLYCCFLADIAEKLRGMGLPLLVCHLPGQPEEIKVLQNILGPVTTYSAQQGDDLGMRMLNAFMHGFAAGYQQLLLIGGDCPDLPESIFFQAFEALNQLDCVLGPTRDGGYYLIGFRQETFLPTVFDVSEWGAPTVYADTIQKLSTLQCRFAELAVWEDIDTLTDLQKMSNRHVSQRNHDFDGSQTLNWLRANLPDA